ncbi:hypothetical protein ST4_111 [Aeromonas phage ST4]|nr:hypothetical protein ST4_111 [Aeromonas phage ST4]
MPKSFSLTLEQQQALAAAQQDNRRQTDGMAKWTVVFHDGHSFPYLTNDCRDRASALLAAVERFGSRVKDVQ